ncbi:unnamed protein product [Caenorhabditis sp. 36 PRJEB53466]|nr:unnamed protein product [Caenorhabditis sp. 36 PRJEB53466]
MDDFYLTLPSSVPNPYFRNTSSSFVTSLPDVLRLEKDNYTVAVTDLIYPYSFKNVNKVLKYYIHFKDARPPVCVHFPANQYNNVNQVLMALNGSFRKRRSVPDNPNDVKKLRGFEDVLKQKEADKQKKKDADVAAAVAVLKQKKDDDATAIVAAQRQKDAKAKADTDALKQNEAGEQKKKDADAAAVAAAQKQKDAKARADVDALKQNKADEQKKKDADAEAVAAAQKQKDAKAKADADALKQNEADKQKKKDADVAAAVAAQKQKDAKAKADADALKQKEADEQKNKDADAAAVAAAQKQKDVKARADADALKQKEADEQEKKDETAEVLKQKYADNQTLLADSVNKKGPVTPTEMSNALKNGNVPTAEVVSRFLSLDENDLLSALTWHLRHRPQQEIIDALLAEHEKRLSTLSSILERQIAKTVEQQEALDLVTTSTKRVQLELRALATKVQLSQDDQNRLGVIEKQLVDHTVTLKKIEKDSQSALSQSLLQETALPDFLLQYKALLPLVDEANLGQLASLRHQLDVQTTTSSYEFVQFSLENSHLHLSFVDPEVALVEFEKDCAYFLGFTKCIAKDNDIAPNIIDFFGNISTLYVYCDIVDQTIVGNSKSSLLTVVPCKGSFGEMIQHSFPVPRYLPLMNGTIDSIKLEILNEFGEPIQFGWGSTIVTLHFRRIH